MWLKGDNSLHPSAHLITKFIRVLHTFGESCLNHKLSIYFFQGMQHSSMWMIWKENVQSILKIMLKKKRFILLTMLPSMTNYMYCHKNDFPMEFILLRSNFYHNFAWITRCNEQRGICKVLGICLECLWKCINRSNTACYVLAGTFNLPNHLYFEDQFLITFTQFIIAISVFSILLPSK